MEKLNFKSYLEELKKYSGYNFCEYSESSIYRRLEKILSDNKLSLEELLETTKTNKKFVEELVDEITVNTTELFRNQDTWSYLYNQVYNKLKKKSVINVWHAGCSTGQEVYSSLILFSELGLLDKVNVVASDINTKVIESAKRAEYSYKINQGYIQSYDELFSQVKENRKPFDYYFDVDKEKDTIKVKDFIRNKPVFQRHDLVEQDIPFYQKFDLIFCRNVLIYFNGDLQLQVVRKFFDRLQVGGSLVLGSHEGLHGYFKTRFNKRGLVYTKSSTFQFKHK